MTNFVVSISAKPIDDSLIVGKELIEFGFDPTSLSLRMALEHTKTLAGKLVKRLDNLSQVLIVIDVCANSMAILITLVTLLAGINFSPEFWLIENEEGKYVGTHEFTVLGIDYAHTYDEEQIKRSTKNGS